MPRRFALLLFFLAFAGPASAQKFGGALELSGDDEYAYTDRFMNFHGAGGLTIEAWVRQAPGAANGSIVTNHFHGTAWESVELTLQVFSITSNNLGSARQNLVYGPVDDGQWHHVAAVWDGNAVMVYVDGVLDAGPAPAPLPPWGSLAWMHIGARPSTETPPASNEVEGQLDELRLWSAARTPAQILATMNAPLGPEYTASADSGLAGYYPFDVLEDLGFREPGVDDMRDASVQGRHAELVAGQIVGGVTAVEPSARVGLDVGPNPFRGSTTIHFRSGSGGAVEVEVFDVAGRRIRVLRGAGRELVWDGRDFAGESVGGGVYALRARQGARWLGTGRIVKMR